MIYQNIVEAIGNTPILKIDPKVHGLKNIELYAKLEYMNPFGSVKDRTAKAILYEALDDAFKNNKKIIEFSSSNTAKALAVLCSINGLRYKTYSNRIKVSELRMILQILGSEIEEFRGVSDCPDFNDPLNPVDTLTDLVKKYPTEYYHTDQYFNKNNPNIHHDTTGKEIYDDLGEIDYFAGFLGTVGTTVGVGTYLREKNPKTQIIGIAAEEYNHVPGGRSINELAEVGFYKKDFYNEILVGTTQQAIDGLLELNRKCGMLCGPTSGLTYFALVNRLKVIDQSVNPSKKMKCVFIACDRMETYTSYLKKHRPELFAKSTTTYPKVNDLTDNEVEQAKSISPENLWVKLATKRENLMLIDTRGNFAFKVGHIEGSVNILDQLFSECIEQGNIFPKDKILILICGVGNVSKRHAVFLQKQGYDAMSLEGGIMNWKNKELPLVKQGEVNHE